MKFKKVYETVYCVTLFVKSADLFDQLLLFSVPSMTITNREICYQYCQRT